MERDEWKTEEGKEPGRTAKPEGRTRARVVYVGAEEGRGSMEEERGEIKREEKE